MVRDQGQREYVVGIDPSAFVEGRAIVLRARRASAWTGTIAGGLLIALAVFGAVLLGAIGEGGNLLWPVFLAVPGVILLVVERKRFAELGLLRQVWDAHPVPPVAMRMTSSGMDVAIDVATGFVFLPWDAVTGFQVRSVMGREMLQVVLAPGTTPKIPDLPGISGSDLSRVQRGLAGKGVAALGIRFRVDALRTPPAEIDRAAAGFTQGRVRVSSA